MIAEPSNLDKLTEKIYLEGIQQAEQRAKDILTEAETKAAEILKKAKQDADRLINEKSKEIDILTKSSESDIKLKGKQLINDLQENIKNLLSEKILENNVRQTFVDADFLKEIILEIAGYWKKNEQLQLTIPSGIEKKLKRALESSIKNHLDNLIINYDQRLENGFRINKKDDTFVISFSEDDFIELFRSYLNERVQHLLFN